MDQTQPQATNLRKITARGVVLHDGKMLAVRLKQYKGAMEGAGGYWCTPGGKLDAGESLQDCVRREMIEETGVPATVGNLLYVQQFSYNGTEYVEFFFHITNSQDYLQLDLSKASHAEEEIAEIGFVDPKVETVKPALFAVQPLEQDAAQGVARFFSYK